MLPLLDLTSYYTHSNTTQAFHLLKLDPIEQPCISVCHTHRDMVRYAASNPWPAWVGVYCFIDHTWKVSNLEHGLLIIQSAPFAEQIYGGCWVSDSENAMCFLFVWRVRIISVNKELSLTQVGWIIELGIHCTTLGCTQERYQSTVTNCVHGNIFTLDNLLFVTV